MTTEVIVKANHGWPVEVRPISVGVGATGPMRRVKPGEMASFSVRSGQDLLIHEVQPGAVPDPTATEEILRFFAWAHLPEALQGISRPFGELAAQIVLTLPRNAERTAALRKLLEAKDCAVRAGVG